MNRERAKELLPIIEAYAKGKDIQFRLIEDGPHIENDWLELPKNEMVIQTFPANDYEYRVKPKPREFFVLIGEGSATIKGVFKTWRNPPPGHELFKVREVIE